MAALLRLSQIDITDEFESFCHRLMDKEISHKLIASIQTMREHNLRLLYTKKPIIINQQEGLKREICIMDHENVFAHFDVDTLPNTVDKYTLGISTEPDGPSLPEGVSYTGQGFARLVIGAMVYKLGQEKFSRHQLFYIDTDASSGFWDRMGMTENPHYDSHNPRHPERGFEKQIDFGNMAKFSLGQVIGSNIGGRKTKKSKKNRKSKKYKR
jgi:hypothetical protein